MYASKIKRSYIRFRKSRICQGDILRDLKFLVGEPSSKKEAEIDIPGGLEYAVVMNQDCDLSQDYNQRQLGTERNGRSIRTILICPAYTAQKFFRGEHIPKWANRVIPDREVDKIKTNESFKRFHYLAGEPNIGVPEVVLDFKHFYTVPTDIVGLLLGE